MQLIQITLPSRLPWHLDGNLFEKLSAMFCMVHSNLPPITLPKEKNNKKVANDVRKTHKVYLKNTFQSDWDVEKSVRSQEELE